MYLIVGLGNPGDKYRLNRHNIGFMCIDYYLSHRPYSNIKNQSFKSTTFKIKDYIFVKPQTFMNLSGEAVLAIKEYYKIAIENILVIHDDLDLKFGTIKYKNGGSSGGHNGLKSIDKLIGKDYTRARIGIDRPADKDNVADYVLKDFTKIQLDSIPQILATIDEVIDSFSTMPLNQIQANFSKKIIP